MFIPEYVNPFILPIILLLYGETSRKGEMCIISRLLFYTYVTSTLFQQYTHTTIQGVIIAISIYTLGLGYILIRVKSTLSKIMFTLSLLIVYINYTSLLLETYTFIFSIPYYAENSNFFFRESILLGLTGVSLSSTSKLNDYKVEILATIMFILELIKI